jgi:hypothetical protein
MAELPYGMAMPRQSHKTDQIIRCKCMKIIEMEIHYLEKKLER